jgi:hypothetical protein
MLLVEDRNQAEESSTDQKSQQSTKEWIPRERPAEEEGRCVEQEKHFKAPHDKIPQPTLGGSRSFFRGMVALYTREKRNRAISAAR